MSDEKHNIKIAWARFLMEGAAECDFAVELKRARADAFREAAEKAREAQSVTGNEIAGELSIVLTEDFQEGWNEACECIETRLRRLAEGKE